MPNVWEVTHHTRYISSLCRVTFPDTDLAMEILLPSNPIFCTSPKKILENPEQSISLLNSDVWMAPWCLQYKAQTHSHGFHTRHVITRPSFPLQPLASPYRWPSQCSFHSLELLLPPAASLQEIAYAIASPFLSNSYFVLQVLASVTSLERFPVRGRPGPAFLYAYVPLLLALTSML